MSVATLANTKITVQRRTVTKDAGGGITRSWSNHLRIKARVQPLSSSDMIRHSKDDARVTHKVYVPGTPDIRTADRIQTARVPTGHSLYVQGVRNIDLADEFLTIEAEERDDG